MLDDRYVAGLFDGEGCVHIQKDCQVKVMITQKDPAILRLIQKQYGGRLERKSDGKGNLSFNLTFSRRTWTEPFLKAIQLHSIIKRSKIELALRMLSLFRVGRDRFRAIPQPIVKMREEIRDAFRFRS